MALLELKNITAGYDQNIILKDFDLSVEKGEFVSLLGSSGCGKTTCLRMIAGFSEPMAGQIIFNGQDYTKVPPSCITSFCSGIRSITGWVLSGSNSAELASSYPSTWRQNSTTANCIPRQIPKNGICFSRAY